MSSISKSLLHETSLTQLPPPSPPPFTPPRLFTTKQFVLFPTFGRIWECKCSNNSCLSSHLPPAGMGMLCTSLSECQMSCGCRLVPCAPRGQQAGPLVSAGAAWREPAGHPHPLPSVTTLASHWNWEVLCAGQVAPLFWLFGYRERREQVRSQSLRKKSFVAWIIRGGFMNGDPPFNFGSATDVTLSWLSHLASACLSFSRCLKDRKAFSHHPHAAARFTLRTGAKCFEILGLSRADCHENRDGKRGYKFQPLEKWGCFSSSGLCS